MKSEITLLYVDDEPINLFLFCQLFANKYKIITAESGYAGLNKIENNPDINVVISDMKMPGMNGLEFIQRAKELHSSVHYFILTSYDITPEIDNALKTGLIARYFQKPFNMKQIESAIAERFDCMI